ncbi:MAG: FecR domain-containing protein [Spirochaetes bacterium]|nr:FecR domain-containing protein [Spirochaetota bacterium]
MRVILALFAAAAFVFGTPIAEITSLTGNAYQVKDGASDKTPLAVGASFNGGETISTAKGARVTLTFNDDSIVEVAEGTQFTIESHDAWSDRGKNTLSLLFGYVVAKVKKLAVGDETKFQIVTPTAVAAVRGTVFGVGVGEDGASSIGVEEGTVDVSQDIDAPSAPVRLQKDEGVEAGFAGVQKKNGMNPGKFDYAKWNEQRREWAKQHPEEVIKFMNRRMEGSVKAMVQNEEETKVILNKLREMKARGEAVRKANNPEMMNKFKTAESQLLHALIMQKVKERSIMATYAGCRGFYGKMYEGGKNNPEMMKKMAGSFMAIKKIDEAVSARKTEMGKIFIANRELVADKFKEHDIDPSRVKERIDERVKEMKERGDLPPDAQRDKRDDAGNDRRDDKTPADRRPPVRPNPKR